MPQPKPDNPVYISPHALERAIERFEDLQGHPNPAAKIYYEVSQAITDGRMSKSRPAWVAGDRKRQIRHGPGGTRRFAWNVRMNRAYVLKRKGGQWIVTTVLFPLPRG